MRDIERRLVSELMKNSRRSDMELAHVIGVSKPTITRTRERLEKEGVVKEYTMIPELSRLGYQIMALTLGKFKPLSAEEIEKARETLRKAFEKASFATVLLETGAGMGYDGMMLSLHENYSSMQPLETG